MLKLAIYSTFYVLTAILNPEWSIASTQTKSSTPRPIGELRARDRNRSLHQRSRIDEDCSPGQNQIIQERLMDAAEWANVSRTAVRRPQIDDQRDMREIFFRNGLHENHSGTRNIISRRYRGLRHEILDRWNEGFIRISCAAHLSQRCRILPDIHVDRVRETATLILVPKYNPYRRVCNAKSLSSVIHSGLRQVEPTEA